MRILNGPRFLGAGLAIAYGLFWLWYGGGAARLTQDEVDALIGAIEQRVGSRGEADPELLRALRRLGEADDGNEFYMVNLMRHRKRALYPEGYDYDDDVEAAERRYAVAMFPRLLKRAAMPVFLATPTGLFLQPEGSEVWDQVAIVRYRSRRDFLEMAAELSLEDVGVHKWASIEKTQVFPVTPVLSFIWVRSAAAVLLVLVGGVAHFALRGSSWYRPG